MTGWIAAGVVNLNCTLNWHAQTGVVNLNRQIGELTTQHMLVLSKITLGNMC
jgi:hypothetical protein